MSLKEANQLIKKYVRLRDKLKISSTTKLVADFKRQEKLCIEKFQYLIFTKTNKYKIYPNYEDLVQEGHVALLSALKNYTFDKKCKIDANMLRFFWLVHKYVDTRISRCANLHTTIRFPLKYANKITPHRESIIPTLHGESILPIFGERIDDQYDILERGETLKSIRHNFSNLSTNQKKVVQMLFGMNGEKQYSISKVCQKLNISRPTCVKILDQVLNILRRTVQL